MFMEYKNQIPPQSFACFFYCTIVTFKVASQDCRLVRLFVRFLLEKSSAFFGREHRSENGETDVL